MADQTINQQVISPFGVNESGGTEMQVNAAGTPNQKITPLKEATAKDEKLTGAEKLKGLSQLNQRVQAKAQAELATKFAEAVPEEGIISADYLETLDEAVGKILSDQSLDFNGKLKALGNAGVPDPAKTLSDAYSSGASDAAQKDAIQKLGGYQPKMSDFTQDFVDMGYAGGIEEIAELLGINKDMLNNASFNDFQGMVENLQEQEYSNAKDLAVQSALLPPGSAQKEAISKQLDEVQQSGLTVAEGEVREARTEIEAADKITVNGKEMDLQDLFGSKEIQAAAEAYIKTGDETALPANNPVLNEIRKKIDADKEKYETFLETVKTEGESFSKIQKGYANLKDDFGGEETIEAVLGIELDDAVDMGDLVSVKTKLEKLTADDFLENMYGEDYDKEAFEENAKQMEAIAKETGNVEFQDKIAKYKELLSKSGSALPWREIKNLVTEYNPSNFIPKEDLDDYNLAKNIMSTGNPDRFSTKELATLKEKDINAYNKVFTSFPKLLKGKSNSEVDEYINKRNRRKAAKEAAKILDKPEVKKLSFKDRIKLSSKKADEIFKKMGQKIEATQIQDNWKQIGENIRKQADYTKMKAEDTDTFERYNIPLPSLSDFIANPDIFEDLKREYKQKDTKQRRKPSIKGVGKITPKPLVKG